MAHGLSSEQMHKIAQSMSAKGRNGDTELVHVMPEEVALLEKIGAGTTNPHTGLREFNTAQEKINAIMGADDYSGWTSELNDLVAERDADNAGSSSSSSSSSSSDGENSVRQNIANSFTPNDGMYYEGGVLYNDGGSRASENTSWQDTANAATPFDGKSYVNGQMVDGDGNPVTSGHDSVFKTVTNVIGLVANPVAYLAGNAIMAGAGAVNDYFDKDGDGSMFTTDGKSIFSGDGSTSTRAPITHGNANKSNKSKTSLTSDEDTTTEVATEDISGEAATYSTVEGSFGYTGTSKFSSRLNGSQLLTYNYADGTGKPTGTYNGNEKPFHISMSEENAKAFSMSEQGSNLIDQLIADMPADIMDQLNGNISMFTTSDNKVAVVAGDPSSGFIEATYEADKDGMTSAMNDINTMLEYVKLENDASIDGGFMGRVQSYNKFKGQGTPSLQIELTSLQNEMAQYTDGSPQYKAAQSAYLAIERELARRTRSGAETTAKNSVDAVTDAVSSAAQNLIAASA